MSSLGLPQSWNNESDSSLALSIVSRLSKSCVPAAEAGGVSWKLCLMPPNYRHPSPVKQELIQTFKKRTKPTPISSPWPCLALTSPIWPLMWRNCKSTWLCVMLAAAAAVKRVLILTFFVANPPPPSELPRDTSITWEDKTSKLSLCHDSLDFDDVIYFNFSAMSILFFKA